MLETTFCLESFRCCFGTSRSTGHHYCVVFEPISGGLGIIRWGWRAFLCCQGRPNFIETFFVDLCLMHTNEKEKRTETWDRIFRCSRFRLGVSLIETGARSEWMERGKPWYLKTKFSKSSAVSSAVSLALEGIRCVIFVARSVTTSNLSESRP